MRQRFVQHEIQAYKKLKYDGTSKTPSTVMLLEFDLFHIPQCSLSHTYRLKRSNTRHGAKEKRDKKWRRHPDLNWGVKVLQTSALPLGYGAILERITGLEPATSTLARWRSTK